MKFNGCPVLITRVVKLTPRTDESTCDLSDNPGKLCAGSSEATEKLGTLLVSAQLV